MIPNIVKGRGISGALAYAMGQGNDPETGKPIPLEAGEQSRATILGGQNFGFEIDSPERLELARRIMEWQALPKNQTSKTRKLDRDCLHASLSWGDGQKPDRAEMLEAGQQFLKSIGLEKARAVFIAHDDTDHAHIHVIASRIDPETGRSLLMNNDYVAGQRWGDQFDREHGYDRARPLAAVIDAVRDRDIEAILAHLTKGKATFQVWEINRALAYGGLEGEELARFRGDILGSAAVIGLRETADAAVTRYTTRDVLAAEMAVQRGAAQLAADTSHGLDTQSVAKVAGGFTLTDEQSAALRHLTAAEGIGILWGEAGTGKSHTLNAGRAAYEAAGHIVRGLSWTNDVADQMRGDGFGEANTIASELWAVDHGRTTWNRKTVLIVDEAAMVSTDTLARLVSAARHAGAKLILAGDDKQLASIERGGLFETLRQTHGAAILKEVMRVKTDEQKTGFNQMHDGEFLAPLRALDAAGCIHWTDRQSDALRKLSERYAEDLAADAGKRRFMFAYTNADVATLNGYARALHRGRGDLGEDHVLQTKHGAVPFATGDRIQFTGNGRTKQEKAAGLVNGRVGSVVEIDAKNPAAPRLVVQFDAGKGKEGKRVAFVVGDGTSPGTFNAFRHGYAGTIYKGQGKTLDQTYVAHSAQWRSAAAYVALTRHRESVQVFAARETVADIEAMARGMARTENKRAATAYHVDAVYLDRIEASVLALMTARPASIPVERDAGRGEALPVPEAKQDQGRPASVRPKSAGLAGVDDAKALPRERSDRIRREVSAGRPAPTATEGKTPAAAPAKRMEPIRVIGGIARPGLAGAVASARPVGKVLKTAGKALDSVAGLFEGLLGGGPSKPAKGAAQADDKQPLDAGPVPPQAEIEAARRQEQEQSSARRQRYLREFSREVPQEVEKDAEIERDRKGRERTRGE